jgi:hypothetical protein
MMVNGSGEVVLQKGQRVWHEDRHFQGKMAANGYVAYVDMKFTAVGVRYGNGDLEEYASDRLEWTESSSGGYWIVDIYD